MSYVLKFVVRPALWVLPLIGLAGTPIAAQVRYDAPKSRVEILGLERWTLRMLEDSVAHYSPGMKLHNAACMATLRYSLHFRDALVVSYQGRPKGFLSIRVVEPGNARAVQWRDIRPNEFASLLPDYAPLIIPVTDSTGSIWSQRLTYGLQFGDSATRRDRLARADSGGRADYARVVAFLASHQSERDRVRAVRVLDSNSVLGNRIAAALVLSSFPAHDSTWYALVRALRDPHETVRSAAAVALNDLPRRPIDWAPAAADLRAILGGTNLTAMEPTMQFLVETAVSPRLASTLLRRNDQWMMRLLTSEAPMAPRKAQALLVALSGGVDLGSSPAKWRAWIAKL